jgi:hypothetical protein
MPVHKATITVTVFLSEPDLDAACERLRESSLKDIAYEMDEGDMVGAYQVVKVEQVTPDRVKAELEAVGNDGTFFELD